MTTRTDPTDTDQFRRWAAGFVAQTATAVHMTTATRAEPLDKSRELGAILTVALDCLLDNLDDPLARQTLAAMARAPYTLALNTRPTGPQTEVTGACPTCGAQPGRPCTTRTGKRSPSRHAARYRTGDQTVGTG